MGAAAYLALLLVALGGWLVVEMRTRPGSTLRMMAAWGLIFAGALAVAGLWPQIRDAISPRVMQLEDGRLEVPITRDGHAYLTAQVNGVDILFVVDTGASMVALARKDARRIGLDPDRLAYFGLAQTANGRVATAPITLNTVSIGDFTARKVPAVVIEGDVGTSLLGMSFLNQFGRVSFGGGRLLLEW